MISISKSIIKRIFSLSGFEVRKLKASSQYTLLGIRKLPVRSIIDVGANTGQFAKKMRKIFPDANVFCFEPLPDQFEELSKWAKKSGGRVITFNAALGDKKGVSEIYYHKEHSPSSSFLKTTDICNLLYPFTREQQRLEVTVDTLDNYINRHEEMVVQDLLIKLDVQGYEARVISGAEIAFSNAKVCILEASLDVLYQEQSSFSELVLMLDKYGLKYSGNLNQVLAEDGHVIYLDALFVRR